MRWQFDVEWKRKSVYQIASSLGKSNTGKGAMVV
jgi:hypothetical protein